eukprot:tig00000607_g2520.t1
MALRPKPPGLALRTPPAAPPHPPLLSPRLLHRQGVTSLEALKHKPWLASSSFPQLSHLVVDVIRGFLDGLPSQGTGADIFTWLNDTIFRMQARILLGPDVFVVPGMFERLTAAYEAADPANRFRDASAALRYLVGLDSRRQKRAREEFIDIAKTLIRRRLALPQSDWMDDPILRYDLIGVMALDPTVWRPDGTTDDQELFCMVWGTLFGATSNSAPSVGWLIYHLAKQPALRERLLSEWRTAARECGGAGYEAANRVEVVKGLLYEIIRLNMPAVSFRAATQDLEVDVRSS